VRVKLIKLSKDKCRSAAGNNWGADWGTGWGSTHTWVSSSANKIVGHGDSLFFVGTRVCLLTTLSAVAGLFVVLLFDCNATLNGEGVGADIYLVINLVSCGALVAGTDRVNLIKFVRNLFVVSFRNSE
jgi:hypothetical protein